MTVRGLVGRGLPMAVLGAALVLAGAGCSSSSASGRPSTSATLEISTPAPNAVTGPSVTVTMRLDHAHLVPPTQVGGKLVGDQGHIHISVDGQLVAMPLRTTELLTDLTPGVHTIQAEFVASDHLPFANRVVAAVTFRVR